MAAYRSTTHPSTGYSPNEMMFGRQVALPMDVIFLLPRIEEEQESPEIVSKLIEKLEECYNLAMEQLKLAAMRQERDYDTSIVENVYKQGGLVYKGNQSQKKLERPWDGPFVVLKIVSSSVYLLQGNLKIVIVHHDRLKPCFLAKKDIPRYAGKAVVNRHR